MVARAGGSTSTPLQPRPEPRTAYSCLTTSARDRTGPRGQRDAAPSATRAVSRDHRGKTLGCHEAVALGQELADLVPVGVVVDVHVHDVVPPAGPLERVPGSEQEVELGVSGPEL